MVNLSELEQYWNGMPAKVRTLKKVFFVTEEGDMKDFIQDIKPAEQPFLLVVIPSAKASGSADYNTEVNMNLIYVLSKEDPGKKNTFTLQKELQPVMEAVKEQMITDIEGCGLMRNLDISTMHTDPERRLMSVATGWSLGFEM
jgi:hypothetical protein